MNKTTKTGIAVLALAILLIMFRGKLTDYSFSGVKYGGVALTVPNQTGRQNLLVIGGLLGMLGVGLIFIGAVKENRKQPPQP